MEYQKFIDTVRGNIKERLGEGVSVESNQILKNNSVVLDGLTIIKGEQKCTPNIYLNSYYDDYIAGKDMELIVGEIIDIYENIDDVIPENELFTLDYESAKNKIIYRLINFEKNQELLETIPYITFLDLAITFHILVKNDSLGIGTVRVTNEFVRKWKVSADELLRVANINTQNYFQAKIQNMDEIIFELMLKEAKEVYGSKEEKVDDMVGDLKQLMNRDTKVKMYVLSNSNGINGASAMLYQNVVKDFANEIGSDLCILPSSIHEVIMVPFCENMTKESINSMIHEVNETQVPVEDVLSEQAYYYSRETDTFSM